MVVLGRRSNARRGTPATKASQMPVLLGRQGLRVNIVTRPAPPEGLHFRFCGLALKEHSTGRKVVQICAEFSHEAGASVAASATLLGHPTQLLEATEIKYV